MKKTRIYISGKITGDPNWREKFLKAEKELLELHPHLIDAEIFNPAKVKLPEFATWNEAIEIDLMFLKNADYIYMLPDWGDSRGACIERGYATALDIMVIEAAL